jgi:hypothetical protein
MVMTERSKRAVEAESWCLRGSIAVKRHHDQGNSYKNINWGWLIGSEVQSIIIVAGSMVTSRQTWCRRRS